MSMRTLRLRFTNGHSMVLGYDDPADARRAVRRWAERGIVYHQTALRLLEMIDNGWNFTLVSLCPPAYECLLNLKADGESAKFEQFRKTLAGKGLKFYAE